MLNASHFKSLTFVEFFFIAFDSNVALMALMLKLTLPFMFVMSLMLMLR